MPRETVNQCPLCSTAIIEPRITPGFYGMCPECGAFSPHLGDGRYRALTLKEIGELREVIRQAPAEQVEWVKSVHDEAVGKKWG